MFISALVCEIIQQKKVAVLSSKFYLALLEYVPAQKNNKARLGLTIHAVLNLVRALLFKIIEHKVLTGHETCSYTEGTLGVKDPSKR